MTTVTFLAKPTHQPTSIWSQKNQLNKRAKLTNSTGNILPCSASVPSVEHQSNPAKELFIKDVHKNTCFSYPSTVHFCPHVGEIGILKCRVMYDKHPYLMPK